MTSRRPRGEARGKEHPAIGKIIDIVLHLDKYLASWAATMGGWLYGLLFAIIFCETGLVVTPFLPGDSLLFAAGAIAALDGSPLHPAVLIPLLVVAGVLGDAVNYAVGLRVGPAIFKKKSSRLLNVKHLEKAQAFYERHGGKTIILARFVPIVRTFAPFVAGIGKMKYRRFFVYNVVGAIVWVAGFVLIGFFFGQLPVVKRNFQLVILAILILSVMPIVVEFIKERRRAKAKAAAIAAGEAPDEASASAPDEAPADDDGEASGE